MNCFSAASAAMLGLGLVCCSVERSEVSGNRDAAAVAFDISVGASSTATTPIFRFDPKRRSVYRLEYRDRLVFHLPGRGPAVQQVVLTGDLHLRVFPRSGAKIVCAFQLSGVQLQLPDRRMAEALAPLYGEMFALTLASDGTFQALTFPLHSADQQGLRRLIQLMQIIVVAEGVYTRTEATVFGEYDVVYQRRGAEVAKRRLRLTSQPDVEAAVRIIASRIEAWVDTRGNWLQQLRAEEEVEVRQRSEVTITNKTTLRLTKLERSPAATLAIWSVSASGEQIVADIARRAKSRPSFIQALAGRGAHERIADRRLRWTGVLRRLRAAVGTPEMEAQRDLEALIEAHGIDASRESVLLRECNGPAALQVISALESVGSAQSQRLLSRLARDTSSRAEARMQAIVALGGVAQPTRATVTLLSTLASAEEEDTAKNSALLSLGALASRVDPGRQARLDRSLVSQLGHPDDADPAASKVVLLALKNAGIERFISDVIPFLRSRHSLLRMTAATVLRRASSLEVRDALRRAIEAETLPPIQEQMRRTLRAQFESPGLH